SEKIFAENICDVIPLIQKVDDAAKNGKWAVLMLSYEAAPAFDPAFTCHKKSDFPLACAFIFDKCSPAPDNILPGNSFTALNWNPLIPQNDYNSSIEKIQKYIAAGDTYQVNYTFPLEGSYTENTIDWYYNLCMAQRAPYCCYINFDDFSVLSISPELFFQRKGNKIITKPMKGTAKRGRWNAEDIEILDKLQNSKKNRAENLMIVDLLRNDLGRIAKTGSVKTLSLFDIEKYDTVFQMTSTIEAECDKKTSLNEILKALFPCGSITGAPKIRTMEIINEVEKHPRGIYTGAIGYIKPGGDCIFNVPIRTITIKKEIPLAHSRCKINDSGLNSVRTGMSHFKTRPAAPRHPSLEGILGGFRNATFNVGGGIVIDSTYENEYEECLTKSSFLSSEVPDFKLLESLLIEDGEIFLYEEHLKRIKSSAEYFDYIFDEKTFGQTIKDISKTHSIGKFKIRILSDRNGNIECEVKPIQNLIFPRKIKFADKPIDSSNKFLFHKTTNRKVYNNLLSSSAECDDVILWNEKDEITETTICNIVVEINGEKFTPPIKCGLLGGTFRDKLISTGEIKEKIIKKDELLSAEKIYLINSVRKYMPAKLLTAK
ncbi:chorismate-binding protein, partial [bacterium]|nr:chorismate-binding protein [bacterium]